MSNESDLMRMLEPAVRPGGIPGPTANKVRSGPIETRDFVSLLAEAQQETVTDNDQDKTATEPDNKATEKALISQLSQVDRVENSSLIGLIGNHSTMTVDNDLTDSPSFNGDK